MRRLVLAAVFVAAAACGARTDLDMLGASSVEPSSSRGADATAGPVAATMADAAPPASVDGGGHRFVGAACRDRGHPVCPPVSGVPGGPLWAGCFYVECEHDGGGCKRCTCDEDGGWGCVAVHCPYCPR